MGRINSDSVRGARIGQEIVCTDCITGGEWTDLHDDQIFTEKDVKDSQKTYTCDRCGDELYGNFEDRKKKI